MKDSNQNRHEPKSMGFIDDYTNESIHNRSTVRKTEGRPVYSNPLENESKPKRKITKMSRKRYRKQNTALWLICIFLVAVTAVSLIFIIFGPEPAPKEPDNEAILTPDTDGESAECDIPMGSSSPTDSAEATDPSQESKDPLGLQFVSVSTDDIHKGNLILVNYKYKYEFPEEDILVSMFRKSDYFSVNTSETYLQQEALDSFCSLTEDLYENSGCDDVIVVSAFRSVEKQQEIYQDRLDRYGSEYAASYVADPGYSEHHTGLALDLSVYADNGLTYDIDTYEDCTWFMENFTEYGYILRYPEDKASITSINFESWHYRYVSLPHSLIMEKLDLCLEEYIDYLKDYTADGSILVYNSLTRELSECTAGSLSYDGNSYYIYYAPASQSDTTDIPLLPNTNHSVSGNNADGFIVTSTPAN